MRHHPAASSTPASRARANVRVALTLAAAAFAVFAAIIVDHLPR
ncbi:MAG: hypothetical protein ACM3Y9_13890 [Ignavibacteria bacterium]